MSYISYTPYYGSECEHYLEHELHHAPKIDLAQSNNLCRSKAHNSQLYVLRNMNQTNKST